MADLVTESAQTLAAATRGSAAVFFAAGAGGYLSGLSGV